MGILSGLGNLVGSFLGFPGAGNVLGTIGDAFLGAKGQSDQNSANAALMREQMHFNAMEADKNRAFQTEQRATQYQTAMEDMRKAGLNPMLAYAQGGAGTTSGATASAGGLPQMGNKVQAGLTSSAQVAQIDNTKANTAKTIADTALSAATAKQVEADTVRSIASTGQIHAGTEQIRESIDQIRQNVKLQTEQTRSEVDRRVLLRSQAALADVERMVEEKRITLVQAQEMVARITAKLNTLEIPGAENRAGSEGTWWGKNVRPYLNDVGAVTNSAGSAMRTIKGAR